MARVAEWAQRVAGGDRELPWSGCVVVWENPPLGAADDLVMVTQPGRNSDGREREPSPQFFEVRKRDDARNAFAMGITLGRAETNDIDLDDASVSRFHAYLQQDAKSGEWMVVDADSRNGTWVGPLKLEASRPERISDGARIKLGDVNLTFMSRERFLEFLSKYRPSP